MTTHANALPNNEVWDLNGQEYSELRGDILRLSAKLDEVIANHSDRLARIEQGGLSQASVCSAHSDDIKELKHRAEELDRAILRVSMITGLVVSMLTLVAKPLVEHFVRSL